MTTPLEDQLAAYDKAKAEPDISSSAQEMRLLESESNREYLMKVCGALTATEIALHDAQKEIDALKAERVASTPEIAVATAYMCAEDFGRKEIDRLKAENEKLNVRLDAMRERAEKAEAALATVQDLSHPNCKMLIKERDSMRGMWDNASLDAFQRLKGELQESGGLAYILNLTINLLKDRKAVYNKLSTVAEERDALKTENEKLRNEIKSYDEHLKIEHGFHMEAEARLAALTRVIDAARSVDELINATVGRGIMFQEVEISSDSEEIRDMLIRAFNDLHDALAAARNATEGTV